MPLTQWKTSVYCLCFKFPSSCNKIIDANYLNEDKYCFYNSNTKADFFSNKWVLLKGHMLQCVVNCRVLIKRWNIANTTKKARHGVGNVCCCVSFCNSVLQCKFRIVSCDVFNARYMQFRNQSNHSVILPLSHWALLITS